jgi:hypothetical protein
MYLFENKSVYNDNNKMYISTEKKIPHSSYKLFSTSNGSRLTFSTITIEQNYKSQYFQTVFLSVIFLYPTLRTTLLLYVQPITWFIYTDSLSKTIADPCGHKYPH